MEAVEGMESGVFAELEMEFEDSVLGGSEFTFSSLFLDYRFNF